MSENITLEVINESVFLTQVVATDVVASTDAGNVTIEQVLPNPVVLEILGGAQGPAGPAGSDASVTEANITTALGYLPASPNEAIAYAIALG